MIKDVVSDQESPCLVGFARGLLLNNRLQTEGLHCNWELRNANKANENRSVRTGQGELANRRHHVGVYMGIGSPGLSVHLGLQYFTPGQPHC